MIKDTDISRAVRMFKQWDLEHKWKKPDTVFINHLSEKSDDCLNCAEILIKLINENNWKKILPNKERFNPTLWIINPSYYSMFFNAQLLLAYDNKKLPDDAEDTHKTILLAILYYFIIKGSGLEGKKKINWNDIKKSRLSNALLMLSEAQEEVENLLQLQRAKIAIEDFERELDKRRRFTYKMNIHAEQAIALTSYKRAINFRTIITEYIEAKRK